MNGLDSVPASNQVPPFRRYSTAVMGEPPLLATVYATWMVLSPDVSVTTGALGVADGPTVVTSDGTLAPAEFTARTVIG